MMLAVTTRDGESADVGGGRPDRDQRGQQAAGDLLVEAGQPAARHPPLDQVHQHRRTRRDRADPPVAADQQADAGAHRAPAEGHCPARQPVPGGDDAGQPAARLVAVDRTSDQVPDQVVDLGQVRVVDLPVPDLTDLDQRGVLEAGLVAHGQLGERHVRGRAAEPAAHRDVEHGGSHVGRAGPRGQQHLPGPQAQVEGLVDVSRVFDLRHRVSKCEARTTPDTNRRRAGQECRSSPLRDRRGRRTAARPPIGDQWVV